MPSSTKQVLLITTILSIFCIPSLYAAAVISSRPNPAGTACNLVNLACADGYICVVADVKNVRSNGHCHRLSSYAQLCEGRRPFGPVCDSAHNLYCAYPEYLGWLWRKIGISGICLTKISY